MKCRCPQCGFEYQNLGGEVRILDIIKEKKRINIAELSRESKLARPSVYYHLMNLKSKRLINMNKAKMVNGKLPKGNPTFVTIIERRIPSELSSEVRK